MEPDAPTGRHLNPRWSRRLLLPLSCAGLIVLCLVMLRAGPPRSHTVSRVIRDVHQVALKQPDGGLLGSWWISAKDIDPLTGNLLWFNVEAGPLHFGAETARVVVDPDANTFQFVMTNVVVVRAERGESRRPGGDFLLDMDAYTLGPIPYHIDIVADSGTSAQRDLTSLRSDASSAKDGSRYQIDVATIHGDVTRCARCCAHKETRKPKSRVRGRTSARSDSAGLSFAWFGRRALGRARASAVRSGSSRSARAARLVLVWR